MRIMRNLLTKYRNNNISPEELDRLGSELDCVSDTELAQILEKEWLSGGERRRNPFRVWMGVAAGLLVTLCVGLSLKLAHNTKVSEAFASQEILVGAGNRDKSIVKLPDGTTVTLNAKSSLSYSPSFGITDRAVRLTGEGYFDVAKDPQKKFTVSAQGMEITVHGTKFNVYAYPENDTKEVSLVEGSISLKYGDSQMKLSPNEKVCISSKSGRINLFRTDNSLETEWLEDRIVFINRPLYQVVDILQRHFGVSIECAEGINLTDRYTGTFTEHRIGEVLDILKMHYGFTYSIDGDKITINK